MELVVVAGIITIITTAVLARHNSFDSTVLLRSLSYEIALSIRQAQIYGLSVREQSARSGNFDIGYGVYFSAANPTSYILFADVNTNGLYDDDDESVEVFTLRRGFRIQSACATSAAGSEHCARTSGLGELTALSIAFQRPDPDAHIRSDLPGETYSDARITLLAPDGGSTRVISVETTGQIAVEQAQ